MKVSAWILVSIFLISIAAAAEPYIGITKGFFESVFDGANVSSGFSVNGDVTADDFLYQNGSTCCGAAGGGGGADGNTPWLVDNRYIYNGSSSTITLNESKLNLTINASIDLRVTSSFLQNLLDSIYVTFSDVQAWISGNMTEVSANISSSGNWTADQPNYAQHTDVTNNATAIRSDIDNNNTAIRADIATNLTAVRADITNNATALRGDIDNNISAVRSDIDNNISALDFASHTNINENMTVVAQNISALDFASNANIEENMTGLVANFSAQDECSEITNCVPDAFNNVDNITGFVNSSGDTMTGDLNMSTNAIHLDGITLKPVDEKNPFISGPAFGFYMTGPSGQNLPHMILSSGGTTQASIILRSVIIANEVAGFHNTTNATDCADYMTNISETLKIDCDTNTTGADLLVSDDLQVVGDVWLKDVNDEWHHLEDTLTHLDNLQDNVILDDILITGDTVGGVFNVTLTSLNGNIEVNVDEMIYDIGSAVDTINLTPGTNATPQINYIYYKVVGNEAVLTATTTEPSGFEYTEVVRGFVGDVSATKAEIFGFFLTKHTNYEFIDRVYKRFHDEGTQYLSGFDTDASSTDLNITVGSVRVVLEQLTYTNEHNLTTGFWVINSTGNFVRATDLSIFTEYADGTETGVTDRISVVWGLIPQNKTVSKLLAIIPEYQGAGDIYNSDIGAEEDTFSHTNFFPADSELKAMFIPIARTIVRPNADEFVAFQSGKFFKFIAGQVTSGGSAPTSAVSDHGNLDGLGDDDHDGVYYTEAEVDNNLSFYMTILNFGTQISNYINFTYFGTQINNYINKTDFGVQIDNYVNKTDLVTNFTNLMDNSSNVTCTYVGSKWSCHYNGTVTAAAAEAHDQDLNTTSDVTFNEMILTGNLSVNTSTLFVDTDSGMVGIGTTSPSKTLTIGDGTGDQYLKIDGAGIVAIDFDRGVSNGWIVGQKDTDDFVWVNSDSTTEFMRIETLGDVGIGTNTPTSKLHVNGTINATQNITSEMDITVQNTNKFCLDGGDCTHYITFNGTHTIIT